MKACSQCGGIFGKLIDVKMAFVRQGVSFCSVECSEAYETKLALDPSGDSALRVLARKWSGVDESRLAGARQGNAEVVFRDILKRHGLAEFEDVIIQRIMWHIEAGKESIFEVLATPMEQL